MDGKEGILKKVSRFGKAALGAISIETKPIDQAEINQNTIARKIADAYEKSQDASISVFIFKDPFTPTDVLLEMGYENGTLVDYALDKPEIGFDQRYPGAYFRTQTALNILSDRGVIDAIEPKEDQDVGEKEYIVSDKQKVFDFLKTVDSKLAVVEAD